MKLPVSDKSEANTVDVHLNWVNLCFFGSESYLEKPFQDKYYQNNIRHLRNCHFYAILFYILSCFIDYILFPENLYVFLSIRFFIVIPIFILGYIFTYSLHHKNFWQQVSFFYVLLTGGSFIAFIIMAEPPNSYDYYVGVFFCIMFGYTFIRERFIYASTAGLILLLGYLFISVFIIKMPAYDLYGSNFYLILANILGMLISRHLEISARRDFYLEHKLFEEQNKVLELNTILEQKVKERTHDLELSNEKLKDKIDALYKSESERSTLEAKLRQAYKMEAIGTLAGGIAHDFNNILASIIGYTELSLKKTEKGTKVEKYLQQINIAAKRAKELVAQILTFARRKEETLKPVQVSPIVKEVIKLLRSSIPSNIEIKQNIKSDAFIIGDMTNIYQVIMNLATNATHAMHAGGSLEIITLDIKIDTNSSENINELAPGDYVKIIVSDTGTGIKPDIIESIFEPYFTTKEGGEGTGMGLAMVYGIVKKYNGEITVQSKLGTGSVFTVYLPVTNTNEEAKLYQPEELPTGTESILFVDDELPLADMGNLALTEQGYKVTVCNSSVEAFALFKSTPNKFDLIITDMTMPNITGDKLAIEILKIRPDIPVVLCTGYSKTITEQKAKEIGIKAFAYKPISVTELAKTVRKVLDEAKG